MSTRGTSARRAAQQQRNNAAKKNAPTPVTNQEEPVSTSANEDESRREEREFLLRSIADLDKEFEAGDVDEIDYQRLRDSYVARAAALLGPPKKQKPKVEAPKRKWQRTAAILVIVGVVSLGIGWAAFRNTGFRAPGDGLTGDARQDSSNLIVRAQGFTGQAQTALQQGDPQKAIELFERAIASYNEALALSPNNVQAITYRSWVFHTIAVNSETEIANKLDAESFAGLSEAIAIDPNYPDARVFRAILNRNSGNYAAARSDLRVVDTNDIPPFMRSLVDSVRKDVENKP